MQSAPRPKVTDVFTPRAAEVNPRVYIARKDLEDELVRAMQGAKHIVLHGESGGGKTWLYQKTLNELNTHLEMANCANAARFSSIEKELSSVAMTDPIPTGYVEAKKADIGIPGLSGGLGHEEQFSYQPEDAVLRCFKHMRKKAGLKPCVLVLDNLEHIFQSATLMDELGAIITLVDDPRYAQYKVKVMLVGVPAGIREYYSRTPHRRTVANRLQEISEISRLSSLQVNEFIQKGFIGALSVKFEDGALEVWQKHVFQITLGVPQALHEYCAELGHLCEGNGWVAGKSHLKEADKRWLRSGLTDSYGLIDEAMNERETKTQRKNQVLFTIGAINSPAFRASDIERKLRQEFPVSTQDKTLSVSPILAELEGLKILRRAPKGENYVVSDPRLVMAIRVFLEKNSTSELVQKVLLN